MGVSNIYRYRINGVIDTARPVLENMETLASSAGSWISYDIMEGNWAVVINKPGNVVAQFNDNNIIGGINLTQKGLTELYNSVEVQYPNNDILDQSDFITIVTPPGELNPNEPENQLSLNYPMASEPTQAQLLGFLELKQSRLDQVIQFTTDYGYINVTAGDVIDITNSVYGWTNKQFRVVSVTELEDEAGIRLQFTALQYDESVYSTDDLYRYLRLNDDGIITIGAIGVPTTPVVTKYEGNTRPHITVTTNVPDNTDPNNQAGIVQAIEFWTYQIPDSELPTWELVDDTTRAYNLAWTFSANSGEVLQPDDEVIWDLDTWNPGNFLVKVRARNGTTTGEFSDHSGLVDYDPLQIAGAVGANTAILDDADNPLAGLLAANGLLYLLNGLMTGNGNATYGNATVSDVYGDVVGNIYDATGTNLYGGAPIVLLGTGSGTNISIGQSANVTDGQHLANTSEYVAQQTGYHKLDVIFDQNTSDAVGGRGAFWSEHTDHIQVLVVITDNTANSNTFLYSATSGGPGAQYWTDFNVTSTHYLYAGNLYQIWFSAVNYTNNGAGGNANFDFSFNWYPLGIA